MAILLNDRNQLLFSASSRVTGAGVIVNSGSATTIVVPRNATVATPATITLTANAYGYITPAYTWSYRYGTSGAFTALGLTANPVTLNLDSTFLTAATGNSIVQYRVEVLETTSNIGINQSEHILSVPILREGQNGLNGINSATVFLYKRTATDEVPSLVTLGDSTYTFASGQIVGQPSGWEPTIPPSIQGQYLWVVQTLAAGIGLSYAFANTLWTTPQIFSQDGISGTSTALIYAYKRSITAPTDTPGEVAYSFTTNTIVNYNLANSWSKTIPDGSNPLYVIIASASSNTSSDVVQEAEWSTPTILARNGIDGTPGAPGINTATIFLYARSNNSTTSPTFSRTGSATYTFATAALAGTIPSGWTQTIPAESGGSVIWAVQATAAASSSTYTISNNTWSVSRVLSERGTIGADGVRGSRQLFSNDVSHTLTFVYLTNPAGASSYAVKATALIAAATSGTIPITPIEGDIVTFTNGTNFVYTVTYNKSTEQWVLPGTVVDGSLLVTGSVTAAKINTTGLSIRNTSGSVILDAGTGAFSGNVTGSIDGNTASGVILAINNATTAAASKLSRTTSDILSATISVDAVTGAGFRAGNLTWDAFGVRTGGSGVALTPGGLLGHNGSKTTFAINSLTGDAVFGGTVEAALLRSTDNKFIIDLANKYISITI